MAQPMKAGFRQTPRPSLGLRMMSILGVFAALILVGFTASAVYFINRAEISAWQGRQGEAARNAAGIMAAVINRAQDTLVFASFIHTQAPAISSDEQQELNSLLEQNPSLEEVIRLDANGQLIFETHRSDSVLAQLITIPQSRWFLVAQSGQPYLGPVELSYDIQPYLLLAIPAPDGGVVAARVQIGALWTAVADIRFGEAGRAYVITQAGEIVAHTDTEVVLAGVSIAGRPELRSLLAAPGNEWHGEYTNFQGERVVGATAPVPNTDWVVITELPRREAFTASQTALAVLGGGLLLVTALLMWSAARVIERVVIRPMGQLRDGAARLGRGDLDFRIGLARDDEIGQLAQAFDTMAENLGERDRQVAAQTAALRLSEARYRAIVEDQTELICRYRPDGTLTFVNEAYCRYFGQTRAALIGHSFVPLVPAEDQPLVEAFVASLGPQNAIATLEHRVILPGDRVRWQHWTDRVIFDAGGQVLEFQAVGQDITERRLAEQAVRASREQLRRITDNMFDVISQIDTTGVIEYASPSHAWVLGLDPNSVIGQPIFDRLHPDDLGAALTAFMEAFQGGDSHQTVAFRYRHAAGHYVWMEAASNFIRDAQGEVAGVILSSRDISARMQMESARRESERLYRLLAENSTDVIWVRDMNLRPTYISPSVYKLRGFTAEEAMNQGMAETMAPGSVDAALEYFAGVLVELESASPVETQGASRRLESELLCKDGTTVWTELVMSLLFDEQGRPSGIQGVTRDISERREAAEALRRANLALEDRVRERTADLVRVNADLTAEVAERQRAELALRDGEARLRRITDNMLDMIVQTDELGQYVYVSPSHTPIMGYEPQTLLGRSIFENIHPDDAEQALASILGAVGAATAARMELRFRRADGHYLWIESVGNPLFDAAGQLVGSIIGSRDITARKAAEAQLVQLRQAVDNSSEAVFMTDPAGVISFVNSAFTRLYGYEAAEVVHRATPRILKSGAQAPADYHALWQTLLSKQVATNEFVNRAKDGRMLTIEGTVSPILDDRAVITGFLAIQRDISRRKQAERRSSAFAALGRQLSGATTPAAAAEVIAATADQLLGWDVCFLDLYQAEQDQVQTALAIDTVDGRRTQLPLDNDLHPPSVTMRKVLTHGSLLLPAGDGVIDWSEMEIFGDGSDLPASLLFVPMRSGTQTIGCLSIQSYTRQAYDAAGLELLEGLADHCGGALERIWIEERVRASLHEKEVLLKEIHHRVKNNLQIISSLLNLQSSTIRDRQTVDLLRDSQSRVRSMALVHEKLYQSPDLARVSFAEYARSLTAQLFRTYSTAAAAVVLELDVADVWLNTDEAIPCGLIINELVSNALKHGFPHGREGVIGLTMRSRADGHLELQVSDTGVGFPPGFELANSPSLGLKLVNTLVEQLGGTVQVAHGAGTRFNIDLRRPARAGFGLSPQ